MKKIICQWDKTDKFVINPDGQVLPCCYFANPAFTGKIQQEKYGKISYGWDVIHDKSPVIQEYFKHQEDLNIFNKSLSDILAHEWFQEILPKSWEKEETTHKLCKMMCEREI